MIKIGNYCHKYEKIGSGTYSTVYKGYSLLKEKSDELYAIKEIDIEENKSNIQRFYLEVDLMRKLDHPNIIKLHDYIENEKYIYIIMEYCKYGDLRYFLKGKPISEFKTQIIMKQLISALKYLYNNKVFHRDLKPQNILVSSKCIIKITDFGLAKKEIEENKLSETICGSPIYMAPEIIKKKKYNNKADIWSIGIIFYELLTGKNPYNVRNFDDLVDFINKKNIKIPKNLMITDSGRDLLSKLLVKNSEVRIKWSDIFVHPWITSELSNSILFKTKVNLYKSTLNKSNNSNNSNKSKNSNNSNNSNKSNNSNDLNNSNSSNHSNNLNNLNDINNLEQLNNSNNSNDINISKLENINLNNSSNLSLDSINSINSDDLDDSIDN